MNSREGPTTIHTPTPPLMTAPKSATLASLALLGASLLLTSTAFAETTTRAKLIAERDAILVQLVQDAESHYASGTANSETVFHAKRMLLAFRSGRYGDSQNIGITKWVCMM